MSGISPQLNDQLQNVRTRINAQRDEIARLKGEQKDAKSAFETDGGVNRENFTENAHFMRASRIQGDLDRAQAALEALKGEETYYLSRMSGQDSGIFSRSFLQDPAMLQTLSSLATSRSPIGPNMDLGRVTSREELVAQLSAGRRMAAAGDEVLDYSTTGAARTGAFRGIVPQLRRNFTLLDLIPTETMDNNVIPYVREEGSLETAAETVELATKPAANLVLVDAEAKAVTIPVWYKLARQTLNDIGGLAQALNNRLLYAVRSRFEIEILSGNGVGENITGILNTSGIATVDFTDWSSDTSAIEADGALDGIVGVMLADAQPSGVVMHPNDWMAMQKAKADTSGVYLSGGPFGQTPRMLWGLPVVLSRIMPTGQALVGDFNAGATALVREAPNVRISDSDQDDFTRNRITVLAEGRFALAVWQPTAFAVVQLTDPS